MHIIYVPSRCIRKKAGMEFDLRIKKNRLIRNRITLTFALVTLGIMILHSEYMFCNYLTIDVAFLSAFFSELFVKII